MNPGEIITSIRYFGIYPVLLGAWHRAARKTGYLKRKFPLTDWSGLDLSYFTDRAMTSGELRGLVCDADFFPVKEARSHKNIISELAGTGCRAGEIANAITKGQFRYFSAMHVDMGQPVNWHRNPFSGAEWPADTHWCDTNYFSDDLGDIKLVWEISRFSWAFDLVRAYTLTDDPKYVQAFWELFEHWLDGNQPYRGANWSSGQECALRIMAWCFALHGFLDAPASTEERVKKLLLAIAVHGERIEKFISHAIRQKTNHAITEAAGLYTIGTLFPFFKKAHQWRRLGKRILEREGLRQIYNDGGYLQHSMNYHRLMLHTYIWSLRLAELNNDSFSDDLKDRIGKSAEFLYQMQDPQTGRVPNYGANDGALILPLNACDYLDYRPVVQSCRYLLHRERVFERGPWDEDLLWLFGPGALNAAVADRQRSSARFSAGGYYTLRAENSWAMVRCHTYCGRVGHVDPLHLDLWADGINLLRDCGTYAYFAPDEPQLEYYFKSIWAHNTVIVDDASPLRLVSRFVWLPWPKAELVQFDIGTDRIEWEGRHFAYSRSPHKVIHSRKIVVETKRNRWEIGDELLGAGRHRLELRWHLPPEVEVCDTDSQSVRVRLTSSWRLEVKCPGRIDVELLKSSHNGGWESLYYAHKQPISTLSVVTSPQLPSTFETTVWKENAQ